MKNNWFDEFEGVDVPYNEEIGLLMNFAAESRTDVSHAISIIAKFAEKPCATDWRDMKRFLRYSKETASYARCFIEDEVF